MLKYLTIRGLLFGLLCLIYTSDCYSQTTTNTYGQIHVDIIKEKRSSKAYAKAEIVKAFAGGDSLWLQSFEKRLNQSLQDNKRIRKGKYFVAISFVQAKDGTFSDFLCLNNPGFGLNEDVKRALLKGMIRWEPARQDDRVVRPYSRSAVTNADSNYHRRQARDNLVPL